MDSDSVIVQEVRQRREEISRCYGDDLAKYAEHLKQVEAEFADRLVDQITVVKSSPPRPAKR